MSRDGTGKFVRTNGTFQGSTVWTDQANSADDTINSDRHDTHDQDIADALTGSLARDGQGSMSGNLPMGGNRIVDLANGTGDSDGSTVLQALNVLPIDRTTSRLHSVQAALSPLFNVKDPDYGAVGDGTTDDLAAIDAAIAAAKAVGGGTIFFPPGTYAISGEIVVDASNILLLGCGSDSSHIQSPLLGQSTTTLKWIGAAAGRMMKFTSPEGAANQKQTGGGCKGMSFDSNIGSGTPADFGLLVESWQTGFFSNLYFNEFDGVCLDVNVVTTLGDATSTQRCIFEQIMTRSAAQANGIGVRLGGSSAGNPSFNHFRLIDVRHENGTGFECGNSDNNLFENIRIFRGGVGTGTGLVLKAGAADVQTCRANYFVSLNATDGGILAEGTPSNTVASYDNHILFYDKDNAGPDPVIETGAQLFWQASDGAWRDFMCQQLGVGETLTGALTARANLGNTVSMLVVNDNEGHIILRNNAGTEIWKMFLNTSNGNLQFNRLAGTGGFNVPGNFNAPLSLGAGINIMQGANDPDGIVPAPVGSLWLRTDGGANTTLYVKENGTGNTGWAAK